MRLAGLAGHTAPSLSRLLAWSGPGNRPGTDSKGDEPAAGSATRGGFPDPISFDFWAVRRTEGGRKIEVGSGSPRGRGYAAEGAHKKSWFAAAKYGLEWFG
jgi:hypothetical protein